MERSSVFSLLSKGAKFNKAPKSTPAVLDKPSVRSLILKKQLEKNNPEDVDEEEVDEENAIGEEEEGDVRRLFRIRVKGSNVPRLLLAFRDLKLESVRMQLLDNIENSRFKEPTAIQMQSIPAIMAGRDVLAVAPTGSGKTASYLIPRLTAMKTSFQRKDEGNDGEEEKGVHTLVIVPTHELADQIVREHEWLTAKFPRHLKRACTLTRANKESVAEALMGKSFYGLVATTPLLLVETLEKLPKKAQVSCVVFDEADRLFEPTFVEQTDDILSRLREENQQRCMFSATMPGKVERLADTILRDPLKISIGKSGMGAETIDQKLIYAGSDHGKLVAFRNLLEEGALAPPVLIFTDSKDHAKELLRDLKAEGINVNAMHGERSPAQRDRLIVDFREGNVWFLVATEILARGVDFRGVNTVINWDLPLSPVSYIHRIGRCGRAGRLGTSFTFFTDNDIKARTVRAIANVVKNSGCEVADWILQLKKGNRFMMMKMADSNNNKRNKETRGEKKTRNTTGGGQEEEAEEEESALKRLKRRKTIKSVVFSKNRPSTEKRKKKSNKSRQDDADDE